MGSKYATPGVADGWRFLGASGGLDDSAGGLRLGALAAHAALGVWIGAAGVGLVGPGAGPSAGRQFFAVCLGAGVGGRCVCLFLW